MKSPASAKFPLFDPNEVSPLTAHPDRLAVHVYVDSQNTFGAVIRTSYTCTVSPLGGWRWQLHDLQFTQ